MWRTTSSSIWWRRWWWASTRRATAITTTILRPHLFVTRATSTALFVFGPKILRFFKITLIPIGKNRKLLCNYFRVGPLSFERLLRVAFLCDSPLSLTLSRSFSRSLSRERFFSRCSSLSRALPLVRDPLLWKNEISFSLFFSMLMRIELWILYLDRLLPFSFFFPFDDACWGEATFLMLLVLPSSYIIYMGTIQWCEWIGFDFVRRFLVGIFRKANTVCIWVWFESVIQIFGARIFRIQKWWSMFSLLFFFDTFGCVVLYSYRTIWFGL